MSALTIPWFTVGPWPVSLPWVRAEVVIHPFEVSVLVAVIVGLVSMRLFARTQGRSEAQAMDLALYMALVGFPASWILNGIFYEPVLFRYLLGHPSEVLRVRLGWSSYGGIVGAILGAWIWKWRTEGSMLRVGDSAAFAVPFAWSIARVGCFLSHDHPGLVSEFPLAVADYKTGLPPYQARHDLGLYEALAFVALAVVVVRLARKRRAEGFYLAVVPMLYTPIRFLLGFLRAPVSQGGDIRYAGLTPGQYASLVFFVMAIVLMRRVTQSAANSVRRGE